MTLQELYTNPAVIYLAGAVLTFAIIALEADDRQYLRQEIYHLLLVVLTWPGFWIIYLLYLSYCLLDWAKCKVRARRSKALDNPTTTPKSAGK